MQLVKRTAQTKRSIRGKIRQALLAARLETKLSKPEILEHYFNRVYYGNGAWGPEQSAQLYFGKSAIELSVAEAATLAVIPRGPQYYDPFDHWDRVRKRRSRILSLMEKSGYLSSETRALAERSPLRFARAPSAFRAPHFVEFAKQRLPKKWRKNSSIATTLDWQLQNQIEVSVETHLARLHWKNVTQAAVVVLDNQDGSILAMVGSRDYADHTRNGAYNGVTARLRPGSALKPFVYAAAIERGDSPASIVYDIVLPQDVNLFYSKDVRSHGFARYREALAGSYNLAAVHTLQTVGVKPVLTKLRDAGIQTLDRPDSEYDWGLAIGHADVRLLDLSAAFSLFGRGGRPVAPRAITLATTVNGDTWREPQIKRPQVFSSEVAYLLFDILSDPDARKPMFGDRVPMNLPFKVALKTGTTKGYTDNWAVGVTREFTVGIWAGNFDGTPTHQVMSVQGATPLMHAVYTAIAARYGNPSAPARPHAIVDAAICPLSGKRPGPHCKHKKYDRFITGSQPTETCDWHQLVCGKPSVVYPNPIRRWVAAVNLAPQHQCDQPAPPGPVRIVSPRNGAKFILESFRPAKFQKPPLVALPHDAEIVWTIDGTPADQWIPSPGKHTVVAHYDGQTDHVSVTFE